MTKARRRIVTFAALLLVAAMVLCLSGCVMPATLDAVEARMGASIAQMRAAQAAIQGKSEAAVAAAKAEAAEALRIAKDATDVAIKAEESRKTQVKDGIASIKEAVKTRDPIMGAEGLLAVMTGILGIGTTGSILAERRKKLRDALTAKGE